jgi:hypothetical protein
VKVATSLARGLSYPATRAQAYRVASRGPYFTRHRLKLLEGAGEDELTRSVKACAKYHRWNGVHVRDSDGVMESIHLERLDGFTEAKGCPDWFFWHEGLGQHFWAELKGASGRLSQDQKREIPSMRKGGCIVVVWYPQDAPLIERVFRDGLEDV